jgi:hypothetical protein
METTNLAVGSRIDHELHGPGVVTFVGADHLGIDFDRGGEALIRRDALERDLPPTRQAVVEPARQALPWPDSTFVPEGKDARHFPGSHWEPFVAQPSEILMRLPEMMSAALPQTTADDRREPPRALPEGWPKGLAVVWPQRTQGLAVVVCAAGEGATIDSLFPFFGSGSLHTLTLDASQGLWQRPGGPGHGVPGRRRADLLRHALPDPPGLVRSGQGLRLHPHGHRVLRPPGRESGVASHPTP